MLLGYMDLPGHTVGSGDDLGPALDDGPTPGGGSSINAAGTLVCTRRIVNELNTQVLSVENQLNGADAGKFF